jgi:hypothetical protein
MEQETVTTEKSITVIKDKKRGRPTKKLAARKAFREAYYGPGNPGIPSEVKKALFYVDRKLPSHEELGIPTHMSKTLFMTIKRLTDIAHRDEQEFLTVRCECGKLAEAHAICECGNEVPITIPEAKLEKNSLEALKLLISRMWGQLANVTAEVNIKGQLDLVSNSLVVIIMKYVPKDMQESCINEISALLKTTQVSNGTIGQMVGNPEFTGIEDTEYVEG